MTVLVIIVVVGALGVWHDRRAKRHGWRTGVSAQPVEQHQGDVAARDTVLGRKAGPTERGTSEST